MSRLLSPLFSLIKRAVNYALRIERGVIIYYNEQNRPEAFDLAWKIKSSGEDMLMGISLNEACQIVMAVKNTHKIDGDIAEVGVYKGGSAKLICEVKGDRHFHLFDTFQGLPKVNNIDVNLYDRSPYHIGQFSCSLESVRAVLNDYRKISFYKGMFPESGEPVKNVRFSFIHLDVDTHESTRNCLEFFYPRLSIGGIIISHDYMNAVGVKKAFDEFFKNKSEPIIELSGSQCLIVKTA
jgi:hypothetical protein